MRELLAMWFGLRAPVTRAAYVGGGALFMLIKFALERTLFHVWIGKDMSVVAFLSPFFSARADLLRGAPDGVTWTMIALAMPFLWLGVSMSVRRALDARLPPTIGFLFLIPGVNYALMAALSVLPHRDPPELHPNESAYRPAPPAVMIPDEAPRGWLVITRAALGSAAVGFGMFGVCVYVLKSYGSALFLATPFVMGMTAAFSYRFARRSDPTFKAAGCAVVAAVIGLCAVGVGLLFLAQEGLACLAMAFIPAGLLAILGAVLAITVQSIARTRPSRLAIMILPLAAGAEKAATPVPLHEVVSSIVVDAPPEVVWNRVVSFPDLPPPTEAIFRAGIAYPMRARIDGQGVGAIRHCEFSTGEFVEPITTWDAPRRLSFSVADMPEPMVEWSFWDRVAAPHLHGYLRSRRGEFRLVPLAGGKTRVEGSTFYELDVYPALYWKAWSDAIIHAIHGRVLEHIKRTAEADMSTRASR